MPSEAPGLGALGPAAALGFEAAAAGAGVVAADALPALEGCDAEFGHDGGRADSPAAAFDEVAERPFGVGEELSEAIAEIVEAGFAIFRGGEAIFRAAAVAE